MADPKPVAHRKPDPERRSEQLHLRISPRDRAVFIAAAREAFTEDVSQWARVALLQAAKELGVTYETAPVLAAESAPAAKVVKVEGSAKRPKAAPAPARKGKASARSRG